MLLTRLELALSLVGVIYAIRCYSGMQGSVNGDTIGEISVLDCNDTDYCIKLPSTGHVGRKHYEGAQYSCDFGECRKEGCNKRGSGGTICCCMTDECNGASYASGANFTVLVVLLMILTFYMYNP
uniref:Activin_recp domain-containing protein n=1 Tax=Caenorhabditis japonica TaxID=281687 RepID=A0A8R1E7Z3_CAEJA